MDSIPMIIAKIDYDLFGMPVRIQFTNGHVTEHVYTSEGEKLKTIHRTAVPNISISLNSTLTLNGSNTLSVDSTDYIGSLRKTGTVLNNPHF